MRWKQQDWLIQRRLVGWVLGSYGARYGMDTAGTRPEYGKSKDFIHKK